MIGKKLMALFVLALLVISVPVFAQDAVDTDSTGTGDPNRVQHGKDVNIVEKTKDQSVNAQNRFKESRDTLRSKQAEVIAAKDLNTPEAQATRAQYVEHQVQYLKAVRDRIEANFELLRYMAENYVDDSEDRAQVVNHIKDKQDQIKEIYANIDNVDTLQEAKQLRDRLVDWYKPIKTSVKEWRAQTERAKLHDINAKMITLNNKINRVIDHLESKGVNLGTDYPAKVAQLNAALESAQSNLNLAKSTYNQIKDATSDTEKQALIVQSKDFADKAREDLKNARNHLHDLITSIRSRAGNQFETAVAQA